MKRCWRPMATGAVLVAALTSGCGPKRAPTAVSPRPVWIDTDPAVGIADRDVDDGVALLQALRSPEIAVVGVSTVFGNAPLEEADPIARALLDRWAPSVPVHRGADGPHRDATPARDALIAALEAAPPRGLTVLVLGPATNLAAALAARPELAANVAEAVVVAGRRPGQRFTTGTTNPLGHRDFNFELDPEAVEALLAADLPLTLAGFPVSEHVWLRADDLDALGGTPAEPLAAPARGWLALWTRTFGVDGFNPFDALAVARVVRPDLLRCPEAYARVETLSDDRTEPAMQGTDAPSKPYLIARPPSGGPPDEAAGTEHGRRVAFCDAVDADAFRDDLLRRLTTP